MALVSTVNTKATHQRRARGREGSWRSGLVVRNPDVADEHPLVRSVALQIERHGVELETGGDAFLVLGDFGLVDEYLKHVALLLERHGDAVVQRVVREPRRSHPLRPVHVVRRTRKLALDFDLALPAVETGADLHAEERRRSACFGQL